VKHDTQYKLLPTEILQVLQVKVIQFSWGCTYGQCGVHSVIQSSVQITWTGTWGTETWEGRNFKMNSRILCYFILMVSIFHYKKCSAITQINFKWIKIHFSNNLNQINCSEWGEYTKCMWFPFWSDRCTVSFAKQANVKQSVLSNTVQDINYGVFTFN
jgi:hypothetical protein